MLTIKKDNLSFPCKVCGTDFESCLSYIITKKSMSYHENNERWERCFCCGYIEHNYPKKDILKFWSEEQIEYLKKAYKRKKC